MEKVLQMVMYFSWALWLVYSYGILFRRKSRLDRKWLAVTFVALVALIVLLRSRMMIVFTIIALLFILAGMFRKSGPKRQNTGDPEENDFHSPLHSFIGMALSTVVLVSLFVMLGMDFKSDTNYFVERYNYKIEPGQKEIVIGNSKEHSDLTLENPGADRGHLRVMLNDGDFSVQNISGRKKVDLNGRYLNKLVLKAGDEIRIGGKERIKIQKTGAQYPLGRSLTVDLTRPGKEKSETLTLHSLLNKPLILQYQRRADIAAGLNKLSLPASADQPLAVLTYEPNRHFLGMNIYYLLVFLLILLLSAGIYLYLRNRFNGALLLLLMAFTPFMAGVVSPVVQGLVTLAFIPFIAYVQKRRKPAWSWGGALLVILFASVFLLPLMLRMDGDFTFRYYDFSKKESITVTRDNNSFQLKDIRKTLAFNKKHRVILGHTAYELFVAKNLLSLTPLNPEKIKIPTNMKAIICDLDQVVPGGNYIHLRFPHQFENLPAAAASGKNRLNITDGLGNSITLSRIENKSYNYYRQGLVFFILLPFWLFWFFNHFGIPAGRRRDALRLKLFNPDNIVIYNFVFFMLGLGYVVFGALALYNNNYFKNFEKFRMQGLPLFVGLFFLVLVLSRYNRWLILAYRLLKQKKYHVPLMVGTSLLLLVNYGKLFLYLGILFFIFVFLVRLRKDIYIEYKNSQSYPVNIKHIVEKTISSFENRDNRRICFGLGELINRKGWNYLMVSDLFLLLALFFIVLQVFLGGELGVSMAGFFFLPIELGKILLTIYFADWVSRIDKGMELNVLWVYGLVLVPFGLLVVFLKDFSPLVVFSFVFLYHIIKIHKPLKFKFFLLAFIVVSLVMAVTELSRYTFPFKYFGILFSLLLVFSLLRLWIKKSVKMFPRLLISTVIIVLLAGINYVGFFKTPSAPRTLGSRISSWLNPWQDYNLSYQYVNSLWLMKGAGTFGKSSEALTAASHVPLIEKDLSFSLYISTLGTIGTVFIFFTLFLLVGYVHKQVQQSGGGRASPVRWYLYVMEFLTVIFLAQFLVPALYVVGLLPVMGQPLPFLSYSNNMLLLFALPFSFLMIVLGNNTASEELL